MKPIPVGTRRLPPPMKRCPLCNALLLEKRLQRHMDAKCPSRPNKFGPPKKAFTKGTCKVKGSRAKNLHKTEPSAEQMQEIFESTMASAGRFGSSRRH